ncbi:hypothetical protein OH807_04985 [Kitasatospora sp. NBC_01560]|uniref:hypothetical protein n=1 Tax=Kitasatospora sp. NBC_01560 TaxID=2975965 RepID=UPI00386FB655
MRAQIAALMVTVAGITAATALPAVAAPATTASSGEGAVACITAVNRPCVWQEKDGGGFVGVAQVSAADPAHLTLVQVEVRTQRSWGAPWVTVASATTVTNGFAKAVTPRVVTKDLRMVCATGGPALDAAQRVTSCTGPF